MSKNILPFFCRTVIRRTTAGCVQEVPSYNFQINYVKQGGTCRRQNPIKVYKKRPRPIHGAFFSRTELKQDYMFQIQRQLGKCSQVLLSVRTERMEINFYLTLRSRRSFL